MKALSPDTVQWMETHLKDIPCSFNVGKAKLCINKEECVGLVLRVTPHVWHYLEDKLKHMSCTYVPELWRKNLLTRLLVERGQVAEGLKINREVLSDTNKTDLPALANLAYISQLTNDLTTRDETLVQIELIKGTECHRTMAKSIIEYVYYFCQLSSDGKRFESIYKILQFLVKTNSISLLSSREKLSVLKLFQKCCSLDDQKTFLEIFRDIVEGNSSKGIKAMAYLQLREFRQRTRDQFDWQQEQKSYTSYTDRALLRQAKRYGSKDDVVTYILGLTYYDNDRRLAVSYLEESLQLNPSNPSAHYQLGKLYTHLANSWERNRKNRKNRPKVISIKSVQTSTELQAKLILYAGELRRYSNGNPWIVKSTKHFEQYLKTSRFLFPLDYYQLAFTYIQRGSYRLCLSMLKNCLDWKSKQLQIAVCILEAMAWAGQSRCRESSLNSRSLIEKAVRLHHNIPQDQFLSDNEIRRLFAEISKVEKNMKLDLTQSITDSQC